MIRKYAPYLLGLSLALWLGGLVALFMFVATLFPFDRAAALVAAPRMFYVFERYQLVLASVAIVLTIVWRMLDCSRAKRVMFLALMLAAILATTQTAVISPTMNSVRQTDPEYFTTLHRISNVLFLTTTACVLTAGVCFVSAVSRQQSEMSCTVK